MKKRSAFVCSLIFSCSTLLAQPILTATGIIPVSGESYIIHRTAYMSPGLSGNQTWDFSALVPGITTYYTAGPRAGSPWQGTFSSADMQMNDGTDYIYYDTSSTVFRLAGTRTNSVNEVYSNMQDILRFPFSLSNTFTDNIASSSVVSGVNFSKSGSVAAKYDGYGTVITPAGYFPNVARIRFTESSSDYSSLFIVNLTSETYLWYANGFHQPIATMTSYTTIIPGYSNSKTQYGTYYDVTPNLVQLTELTLQDDGFTVYPSPSSSLSSIHSKKGKIAALDLYSIEGKKVYSANFNQNEDVEVDVSSLENGIYIAHIFIANGDVAVKKITVQR